MTEAKAEQRQGRIERIIEAFAAREGIRTVKAMLLRWKKQGHDTYAVAELTGGTHQAVSYLHRKYGISLVGNRATEKMEARAKKLRFASLADYFNASVSKTINEQATDLGVSEMTIKRHRKALRERTSRVTGKRNAGGVSRARGKRGT